MRWTTLGAEEIFRFPVTLLQSEDLLVKAIPTLEVLPYTTLLAADDLVVLVGRTYGGLATYLAVELPFLLLFLLDSAVGGELSVLWYRRRVLGGWRDTSIGNDLFASSNAFLALPLFPFALLLLANGFRLELELSGSQALFSFAQTGFPGLLNFLFLFLPLTLLFLFLPNERHFLLHSGASLAVTFALFSLRLFHGDTAGSFAVGEGLLQGSLALDLVKRSEDLLENLVVDELMQVLLVGVLGFGKALGKSRATLGE